MPATSLAWHRTYREEIAMASLPVQQVTYEFALKMMAELRQEIISSQQIRVNIVKIKITSLGVVIGAILAYAKDFSNILFIIPAFMAIFFDFLINSYSFSIKRLGFYIRHYLGPVMKEGAQWPDRLPLYEDYVTHPAAQQRFSTTGNLGLTALAVVPALWGLVKPFRGILSLSLIIIILICSVLAFLSFTWPRRAFRIDPTLLAAEIVGKPKDVR
jgi:hypothetical protein